ncbi:hypothetical protein Cni_G16882 [Canna indica]|uniref:Uncharacterized protein n=1 Tax=Canna indica TaxID=4628 RepID=A0AAQ3QH84_9LILI|nr:hypothetical protein Cni_G16882 [Canna indica]
MTLASKMSMIGLMMAIMSFNSFNVASYHYHWKDHISLFNSGVICSLFDCIASPPILISSSGHRRRHLLLLLQQGEELQSTLLIAMAASSSSYSHCKYSSSDNDECMRRWSSKGSGLQRRCLMMVKQQRTRLYILRRCVSMLLCWQD